MGEGIWNAFLDEPSGKAERKEGLGHTGILAETIRKLEINKEHQYWTNYTDNNSSKYFFERTLNWDLIIFQK